MNGSGMQAKPLAAVLVSVLLLGALLHASGCSVAMALSGRRNPDVAVLRIGASRTEVEREFGSPAAVIRHPDGLVYATYAYSIGNEPSVGRAAAHGVLDVLTLGLWEVVGTPVEAMWDCEDPRAVVVAYDEYGIVMGINQTVRKEDADECVVE